MDGPKILIYDIENAPILADVWDVWQQNIGVNQMWRDWFIMTWAAKWYRDDWIYGDSMFNYKKEYKADSECDYHVLLTLRDMLDEADIVVGHNSKRFDTPKVLTRMLEFDIAPPSPFKQIDTLSICKRKYRFTRNTLAYVCYKLGIGDKVDTGGHELWTACIEHKPEAWKKMMEYNEGDIYLTEALFEMLVPHMGIKPNFGLYVEDDLPRCTNPACGSDRVIRKGWDYTGVSKFRRWKCKDCGNPMRSRLRESPKKNLLVSVT